MLSLAVFTTFFFVLILTYPAVSIVLSVVTWVIKKGAERKNSGDLKRIAEKADRLKDLAFIASVILIFFFISPFAVIYLYMIGAL